MDIAKTAEAHRKAGAELVLELGYNPADVSTDLELIGRTATFTVVHRDAAGNVKVDGGVVVTHVERTTITADQLARYQATVTRESEGGDG